MSAFCPHTCSNTLTPLVNCIINDSLVHATPNVQQMLLQFVNTVQLQLMHSLLDVTTYLVIYRTEVSAIRRPQIWRNESGVDCSRNFTLLRAQCVGVLKDDEID